MAETSQSKEGRTRQKVGTQICTGCKTLRRKLALYCPAILYTHVLQHKLCVSVLYFNCIRMSEDCKTPTHCKSRPIQYELHIP
jgi:hypothetical protein